MDGFLLLWKNENELNFIREAQKFVTDNKSYWIGGSSDFLGPIQYYQYVPNEEGLYMKQLSMLNNDGENLPITYMLQFYKILHISLIK